MGVQCWRGCGKGGGLFDGGVTDLGDGDDLGAAGEGEGNSAVVGGIAEGVEGNVVGVGGVAGDGGGHGRAVEFGVVEADDVGAAAGHGLGDDV